MAFALLLWALGLAGALILFERGLQDRIPGHSHAASGFGGNDWVTWADGPEGVTAAKIHPLIKGNRLLRSLYIQEGDILRRLDYQDVYKAEMVDQVVRKSPPGTVLLFQVDRANSNSGIRSWESVFVENSFDPLFNFTESNALWSIFPWIVVGGAFLSLISLFIIFPIIRSRWQDAWPLFGVILLSFLLFFAMVARHLNLLVRVDYHSVGFEKGFITVFSVLLMLHGLISLRSKLRKAWIWTLLPGLAVAGYFTFRLSQALSGDHFEAYGQIVEAFLLGFLLLHVFLVLLLSVAEKWKGRSKIDRVFHLLSFLYVLPLASICLVLTPLDLVSVSPLGHEWLMFLSLGAVMIPMISATASQLKFGRVSVVLTSSLQYFVFAALSLLFYFLLDRVLAELGLTFKYKEYLQVSALIVVMLVLRWVYRSYESRLRRYFVLAQQDRRDTIDRFIAQIPQYASSQRLLDDLASGLRDYFGAALVTVWMKGQENAGDAPKMETNRLEKVFAYLQLNQVFWTRSRQVTLGALPKEVETPLSESPYSFANALAVNDDIYGLLLISRKKRGVFNLEDLEIISRTIQQTQLTLGVLHLLERERLLLQKNYEANLTALRSQINPHFLFNTLNTISALIHDAPDDAEEAVEKLAFIFRYTLKQSSRTLVTLREEMSLVQTYLEIEKIRFGERLELRYDLDRDMQEVELPAFVVQTIVENAIKHGIAKIIEKGVVAISAGRKGDSMEVTIEDNGPGIDHAKITTSTGLNNITTRLEQIYEKKNLLYFENTGRGTRVTIKIPLQK